MSKDRLIVKLAGDHEIEINTDAMLCNDIVFPGEYNPNKVGLWLVNVCVSNAGGPSFLVWGHDHDILDVLVDNDMFDICLLDEEDQEDRTEHLVDCAKPIGYTLNDWYSGKDGVNSGNWNCCNYEENFTRLGNAGEPFDIDNVSMEEINLDKQSVLLIRLFAEARGAQVKLLSDL